MTKNNPQGFLLSCPLTAVAQCFSLTLGLEGSWQAPLCSLTIPQHTAYYLYSYSETALVRGL